MRQTTERTGVGWSRQRFGPDKPGCWNRKTLVGELYKNNRSKSACTLNARKRLNNQAVWPVIFDITGPICARGLKTKIPLKEWEQDHLHGCRVCQSVYVYLNQRTTAPSENLESEDDAA